MHPERRAVPPSVRTRWGTPGDLAAAAFVVAAVSGVIVAAPFDSAEAYSSIAAMLLANPAATFFRNAHYWSAQLCLVLTLVHIWDHMRARSEKHVANGMWLRITLTVPLLFFIMLSGFILRGDAEAQQALRIISEATSEIPLIGPLAATLIFGPGERLGMICVQHAATATIIVWLFVIEHFRRVWPRSVSVLTVIVVTALISLFFTPGLHDGFDPVLKGPWYFLGLQEILHWTPWPRLVLLGVFAMIAAIFAVRFLRPTAAGRTKAALLLIAVAYFALCGIGAFMRGENWSWGWTVPNASTNMRAGWVFAVTPDAPSALPVPLPVAMGKPEGCLVCHRNVTGLGNAHRPDAVGCAACHGGDVFTLDKARAHAGMNAVAGNLATAARGCGQASCHASIIPRIETSVMNSMSGIVAIDRAVFGEPEGAAPGKPAHIQRVGHTPADTHLRQLCASCHVGRVKDEFGPNGEQTRGGGCNACDLVYSAPALDALRRYEKAKSAGKAEPPRVHPALSLDIANQQCFGCHSRSARISTSYEGWNELHETAAKEPRPPQRLRKLADGRVFERVVPDIHQQRGLDCIDCHTPKEVMGDGTPHARKREQLRVACADCHAPAGTTLATVPFSQLDPESRKILAVRERPGADAVRYVRTRSGDVLVNVISRTPGRIELVRKRSGDRRPAKPTAAVCVERRGHARLSCGSCHTAWAPTCPTCHTKFDPRAEGYDWIDDAETRGTWNEESAGFSAKPPTLGVRVTDKASDGRRDVIDTFVPGMVATIDLPPQNGRPGSSIFRRLYARIEPHTTRTKARSCESCHNDSLALGYGSGKLRYQKTADGGRWRFTPAMAPLPADGLPADAWIPFLGTRTGMVSTRDDVRPFTVEEQRKILTVGACLTCHDGKSEMMRNSVRDFAALVARRSPRCVLPVWDSFQAIRR